MANLKLNNVEGLVGSDGSLGLATRAGTRGGSLQLNFVFL